MLRWTPSGAVPEPAAVQIRVAPTFSGRIRAGAPTPGRAMTVDEVAENLRHFAKDRAGPRTAPCTAAVLSGVDDPEPLVDVVRGARGEGIERVTWHLSHGHVDPALAAAVDTVVRVARGPWDLDEVDFAELDTALHVVVPLEGGILGGLERLAQWLVDRGPDRVVFQWPFPGSDSLPPPATEAAAAVRMAVALLDSADVPVGVKGLPPCILAPGPVVGRWSERAWRSANRFYVDADHQKENALVFFPDVVRLTKVEACRFCRASERCEGVVEDWLRQGLVGVLRPLHD